MSGWGDNGWKQRVTDGWTHAKTHRWTKGISIIPCRSTPAWDNNSPQFGKPLYEFQEVEVKDWTRTVGVVSSDRNVD